MWFRRLIASAACAAVVGLVASAFVRTHFLDVMSALASKTSEVPQVDEPGPADGGSTADAELGPEGEIPEEPPTSVILTAAKGRPAHPAHSSPSQKTARDTVSRELDRGIRKLTERRYEIKRRALELALGNLGLLARWVRVAPEVREGKPFGFRLFAITADGPFAKLGLRNGDVLVSINGLDIATPEHVLDAYSKLKEATDLVLGIVRDGRPITREYAIR